MRKPSTSARGRCGEDAAADFLRDLGYRILERNFRCKIGELDIICRDGNTLVFVEVRSRKSGRHGSPLETVSAGKQRRIAQVASVYLSRHHRAAIPTCRFDVVGITDGRIEHVVDAFRLGL